MASATPDQVASALKRLGNYRVLRAQSVAHEGYNDGIGGAHILALGLRETWGTNIEGGAKLVNGQWVKQDDPRLMDVGWLQISRKYHLGALRLMPGVRVGTWSPEIGEHTAAEGGYVPRFTDSLRFTIDEMRNALSYAEDNDVDKAVHVRFAVAAHNAGIGGALSGYEEGNLDAHTANGDYSAWVMSAHGLVNDWLKAHPNWRI